MNKTAGQLHAAGAPVGGEPDQGAGGFWPPLHSQRHRAVASFLSSCAVTRVLDFGCGEGTAPPSPLPHLQLSAAQLQPKC
jgi:hypothetical protein